MDVDLVPVPYDSGHRSRRMGAGPARVLEEGLCEALAHGGRGVRVVPVEVEAELPTEIAVGFGVVRAVRSRVADARRAGRLPVVLAGNCLASVGAIAALDRPTVVWMDAHGDLHTPDTTTSGFLDGMALAVVLGRCWRGLARDAGLDPVPEDRVHLVGARDLDPAETAFLGGADVRRHHDAPDLDQLGDDGAVHLHVDLDVLDPSVGRANRFAAPDGLDLEPVLRLAHGLGRSGRLACLTLSAYDPDADPGGDIARAAVRVAMAAAG